MKLRLIKTILFLMAMLVLTQPWSEPNTASAAAHDAPCDPNDDDCEFEIPTPSAPAVAARITNREVDSLTIRWSGLNLDGQVGNVLQRKQDNQSWSTIAGSPSQLISGSKFLNNDLASEQRYCYRVTVYLPSTSVTSSEVCETTKSPAIDTDDFHIWRVQAQFVTSGIGNAGTDDDIEIKLNGSNSTWIDYGRDDFERGDTFTYDLIPSDVATIGQIDRFQISKNGSDGWCIKEFTLLINGQPIYNHNFGINCRWLDNEDGHTRAFSVDGSTMRSHRLWEEFTQPIPSFRLSRAEIESRIESVVGHYIKDERLYWGDLHGRAVEVSKAAVDNDQTLHVDLDLSYSLPFPLPDPEVDVDMDVQYSCQNEVVTIEILNAKVEVLGYDKDVDIDPISKNISDILQTANEVWQVELLFGKKLTCVQIMVQANGDVLFELEFEEETATPIFFFEPIRPTLFTAIDGSLDFSTTVGSGVITDIVFDADGLAADQNPADQLEEVPVDQKFTDGDDDSPDFDNETAPDQDPVDDPSEDDGNTDGQSSEAIFLPFVSSQ